MPLNDSPGGADYKNRSVFSYHVYCYRAPISKLDNLVCNGLHSMFHRTREAKAKELGTPAFLTEFGATFNSTYEINDI